MRFQDFKEINLFLHENETILSNIHAVIVLILHKEFE